MSKIKTQVTGVVEDQDKSNHYIIAHFLNSPNIDISVQMYDLDWNYDKFDIEILDDDRIQILIRDKKPRRIKYVIKVK